jgi:hypothetical protein
MKKVKEIVGMLIVVLVTLCSCTADPIEQNLLLKRIVEISVDGSTNTTTLIYNDNKIVNIDKVDQLLKFYYTDDLITKLETRDKTTQKLSTLDYTYTKEKLTQIISSENYVINYVHNNDGTVSYEKLIKDSSRVQIKNYHGILYFQNGNLVKDDKTIDDAGSGFLAKNTFSIEYDSKKNALKNILGFDKLLNYSEPISSNNGVIRNEVSSVTDIVNNQTTSSINRIDSKYSYNSLDYPTEIVSENIVFGGSNSKHLKSQLFYN